MFKIDNYNEDQFKKEKKQMQEVDGFTLIDYIKSSIEILMNMKIDEGGEVKNSKNNTMQTLPLLKQLSEKSNLSPGQGGTFEEEKQ